MLVWQGCSPACPVIKCTLPPVPLAPIRARRKPAISVVITAEKTYNVTVTPVTTTPLISYPAGAWGIISVLADGGTITGSTYCA